MQRGGRSSSDPIRVGMQADTDIPTVRPRLGLLQTPTTMVVALLLCVFFALPWHTTTRRFAAGPSAFSIHGRDPILILGLLCAIFIAASIASRSSLVADRAVFGLGAATFILTLLRELFLPSNWAASILNDIRHILWAFAAIITLILLITTPLFPRSASSRHERDIH